MPYPILANTLAALDAVKNDPQDTEAANQLAAVDRQTRNWVVGYLSQYFDATGLKTGAFTSGGGSLPTQYVRGSDINGTAREIAARTITEGEVALKAITAALMADRTITRDQIALSTIIGENISDATITGSKIANATLTAAHFANLALSGAVFAVKSITADKIADRSITAEQIADNAIDGEQLVEAEAGYVMIGGQVINGKLNCLAPIKLSGAIAVDAAGVATLNLVQSTGVARIIERVARTGNGGQPVAGAWNDRGVKAPWFLDPNTNHNGIVGLDGKNIQIRSDGLYLINVSSPGYRCDGHQVRVTVKPDGNNASTYVTHGTSEFSGSAAAYASTRSTVSIVQAFANAKGPIFPYLTIEHFFTTTSVGGMGLNTGSPDPAYEVYAEVQIIKLA